jgi:hypothetical protein
MSEEKKDEVVAHEADVEQTPGDCGIHVHLGQ